MLLDNTQPKIGEPTPTFLQNMGQLKGVIYDFEKVGDILPKHIHSEKDAHITIVAKGSIRAYSHDWSIDIPAGKVVDFPPEQPHEFMALEDGTRIVNIVKHYGGFVDDAPPIASKPPPPPEVVNIDTTVTVINL